MPRSYLLPVPDVPNRRHPAYEATFEAYLRSGGDVMRALAIVKEIWDPSVHGAEVPTKQAVYKWVREDEWRPILREWATKNRRRLRESLNADILLRMSDALDVTTEIMHDNIPDHAKINSVRLGAANRILTLGAAGVQETRFGDLPDYDIEAHEAVAEVKKMTPEEIIEAEMRELEAARGKT